MPQASTRINVVVNAETFDAIQAVQLALARQYGDVSRVNLSDAVRYLLLRGIGAYLAEALDASDTREIDG